MSTNLEQQIFYLSIWQSKWNTQEALESSKIYFSNEVWTDTYLIFSVCLKKIWIRIYEFLSLYLIYFSFSFTAPEQEGSASVSVPFNWIQNTVSSLWVNFLHSVLQSMGLESPCISLPNVQAAHCNLIKMLLSHNLYAEAKQKQCLHDVSHNKNLLTPAFGLVSSY